MAVEQSNLEAEFNNYEDRCDRCVAQGQRKVHKDGLTLIFCMHHFTAHEATLVGAGWEVISRKTPEPVEEPEPVSV